MATSHQKEKTWRRHILAYKESGLNQIDYAKKVGISQYQLKYWIYRLGLGKRKTNSTDGDSKFAPLTIQPSSQNICHPYQCKLTLRSGAVIEFCSAQDINTIKSLIEIVEGQ